MSEALLGLVWGYRLSQAVYVAARLGLPDHIAAGVRRADELARATGTHGESLYRLLRALAGAGVLEEIEPRCFALTAVGEPLRSDVAGSLRDAVVMLLADWKWRPWGHLLDTVRTGNTAFERVHGAPVFDYVATHPEAAASFDAAMTSLSAAQAPAITRACDLAGVREIVDVGGGQGTVIASLLRRHAALRGVLFDLPHVIPDARALLDREGLARRCRLVGGSFFDSVPEGADACLLRDILHDWDDARAAAILRNCRAALPSNGRLILVERVVSPDLRAALPVLLADLEMLVNIGGRERTEEELCSLLEDCRFSWVACRPLGEGMHHRLIEARVLN